MSSSNIDVVIEKRDFLVNSANLHVLCIFSEWLKPIPGNWGKAGRIKLHHFNCVLNIGGLLGRHEYTKSRKISG